MATTKPGRKHPLLIYQRLYGAWRGPALLIAAGAGLLSWVAPAPLNQLGPRLAVWGVCVIATLLYAYAVLGPRFTYVQCRPTHLLVSTPLYRLAISYRRIHTTRPVQFAPADLRGRLQWLAQPFRGRAALSVDLTSLPVSRRFLRLWLNDLVLPRDRTGLLLVTPDWMALSLELESYRSAWKTHRKDAEKDQHPLTSLSSRKY